MNAQAIQAGNSKSYNAYFRDGVQRGGGAKSGMAKSIQAGNADSYHAYMRPGMQEGGGLASKILRTSGSGLKILGGVGKIAGLPGAKAVSAAGGVLSTSGSLARQFGGSQLPMRGPMTTNPAFRPPMTKPRPKPSAPGGVQKGSGRRKRC